MQISGFVCREIDVMVSIARRSWAAIDLGGLILGSYNTDRDELTIEFTSPFLWHSLLLSFCAVPFSPSDECDLFCITPLSPWRPFHNGAAWALH